MMSFLVFMNKVLGAYTDPQCCLPCTPRRTLLFFCTKVQVSSGQTTKDFLILQFVFNYSLKNLTKAHILTKYLIENNPFNALDLLSICVILV